MPASHMRKIQSSLIDRANVDIPGRESPIVEGIYGSNGFYFQQRRGRLDLRNLAQIDLDRVVRDVDIDTLQMHLENIAFCNLREDDLRFITDQHVVKLFRTSQLVIEYLLYTQEQLTTTLHTLASKYGSKKKALLKKRKELETLQENSKILRAQLRSKKKGIHTLEGLLKDSSRDSRRRRKSSPAETPTNAIDAPHASVSRFFVAGPNGLCVEFHQRSSSSIAELKREVKQAFVSKRQIDDDDEVYGGQEPIINLIYQGKVLMNDMTVDDVGIRSGDTVVAVIEKVKNDSARSQHASASTPPATEQSRACMDASNMMSHREMMAFLTKQHEITAAEMRNGWHNMMEALCTSLQTTSGMNSANRGELASESHLVSKLDERLYKMEHAMNDQLRTQFEQMQKTFLDNKGKRFLVGDLEDDDDVLLSQDELDRKLRESNSRLGGLEKRLDNLPYDELRTLQLRQSAEIDELRRQMARQQRLVPSPQSSPLAPRKSLTPKASPAGQPPTHSPQPTRAHKSQAIKKTEPLVTTPTPAVPAEAVRNPPAEVIPVPAHPPYVEEDSLLVSFSPRLNPCLTCIGLYTGVEVLVPSECSPDDLIFELRRHIAEAARLPLARIALNMDGDTILLGVDVDPNLFTPPNVMEMVASGEIVIELREPITDAQIDVLVNHWEQSGSESESPRASVDLKGAKSPVTRSSRDSLGRTGSPTRNSVSLTRRDYDREVLGERAYRDALARSSRDFGENLLNIDEDEESEHELNTLRQSLNSALDSVNAKGGLSDEEYKAKIKSIRKQVKKTPRDIQDHMESFSKHIPSDVGIAIDSGSEDYSTRRSSNGISGALSMRLLSYNRSNERGGRATSHELGGSGSIGVRTKKRDYDSAEDDYTLTRSKNMSRQSGEGLKREHSLRNSSDSQHGENRQQRDTHGDGDSGKRNYPRIESQEAKRRDRGDDIGRDDDADKRHYPRMESQEAKRRDRGDDDIGRDDYTDKRQYPRMEGQEAKRRDRGDDDIGRDDYTDKDHYSRRQSALHYQQEQGIGSGEAIEQRGSDDLLKRASSSSRHRYNTADIEDEHGDDDDFPSGRRGEESGGGRTFDSSTIGSGSAFGLDSIHSADDGTTSNFDGMDTMDFNQTVNTDVSMPGEDVEEKADEYEREVATHSMSGHRGGSARNGGGLPLATPPGSRSRGIGVGGAGGSQTPKASGAGSVGTSSPFDNIASDFDEDDGSLDLSQSTDNFARMMG